MLELAKYFKEVFINICWNKNNVSALMVFRGGFICFP